MTSDSIYQTFPELESERYYLRQIIEQDVLDLHEVYSDPRVVQYWGTTPYKEKEDTLALITSFTHGFDTQATIRWGIEDKATKQVIGTCGYHNWTKGKFRAEIGYEIKHSEWRKGVMTEVLTMLIPFAFERMSLHRIGALVHPDNQGSKQLLKKFGFTFEGRLRDYQYVNEEFHDLDMYGLLAP
ncbi:ribosomal-protein-alanine acetyltransferase [Fictibacillus macauensis ZFHKF-1]|uniref:Ribosomal-protein-alanine acetyltransferase n=1 Tax=Fictibacillus macauensis ZFHKF-1 TaxID=1196324 RepID=I8UFU2_9BACL|nr:GNAT family protein [Fictibacillus macauensis]EIT85765.1 ribosomal-protein-alanine acetyltransferase [Fictibacillus macauensis ZFHKF-1]